jgi:hypothetical protein
VIPGFNLHGLLPQGVHRATWDDVVERFGGNPQRKALLDGLEDALDLLRSAGCQRVHIDGSFVTAKELPNDIDVCWDINGVNVDLLNEVFLDFSDGRRAQKAQFGSEFFPAQIPEGITGKAFLEFFQSDKETGIKKGIIELLLE